jgi:hypothetical protein
MSDLVERLREHASYGPADVDEDRVSAMKQAADELEKLEIALHDEISWRRAEEAKADRLEKENQALRSKLGRVEKLANKVMYDNGHRCEWRVRVEAIRQFIKDTKEQGDE